MKKVKRAVLGFVGILLAGVGIASAHEAYVLPHDVFWSDEEAHYSAHAFTALKDPHNLHITLEIAIAVIILLVLNFFFRRSRLGARWSAFLERFSHLGPHFVRYSIAIAFFFSAASNAFLGPELYQSLFPHPLLIRAALFAISGMIAVGFLTELAAAIGILIFLQGFGIFGGYLFTYFNYLGELIVLLLFGMRVFSLDRIFFGKLKHFRKLEKYETLIVRVFYGVALIYAALTVKLLHPDLTVLVVNTWHLTQFHWLFPSDPLLVTLGAGIVEMLIGLFIILGFEMRLTIFISLFYITLSLLYFRELVWPHLLLYGISFNLIVQPQLFTLDHLLLKKHRRATRWWKRPFMAHNKEGKSAISAR